MNYAAKHARHVAKTIKWLEGMNYVAKKSEHSHTITLQGRPVYSKEDFWGSDIIFRNEGEVGFVQVKTSEKQINKGLKQLSTDSHWPVDVGRYVIWWPDRSKKPVIRFVPGSSRIGSLLPFGL